MLSHFSCVWLFVTPWTVACQSSLSMGFSRQEYWSGMPCPPPGDLPDTGTGPGSLTSPPLAGWFSTTNATREAWLTSYYEQDTMLDYITHTGQADFFHSPFDPLAGMWRPSLFSIHRGGNRGREDESPACPELCSTLSLGSWSSSTFPSSAPHRVSTWPELDLGL